MHHVWHRILYPGGSKHVVQQLYQTLLSHTLSYVWLAMVLNHLLNHSILSLPFPLLLFTYGVLETPEPSRRFFDYVLAYLVPLIGVRLMMQMPLFCASPSLELRSTEPGLGGEAHGHTQCTPFVSTGEGVRCGLSAPCVPHYSTQATKRAPCASTLSLGRRTSSTCCPTAATSGSASASSTATRLCRATAA